MYQTAVRTSLPRMSFSRSSATGAITRRAGRPACVQFGTVFGTREGRQVMSKAKIALLATVIVVLSVCASRAEKQYDPGASDTSIKIGNTMPYSGPNSAFAVIGRAQAAYFRMVNDQGGINGRKIDYISYDDGYSPPKTVEQVRKLIESDEVLLLFSLLGTPTNLAVIKYINGKKVPHLLIASGGTVYGTLHDSFPGPWDFRRRRRARPADMDVISRKTIRTPGLAFSTGPTVSVATTSRNQAGARRQGGQHRGRADLRSHRPNHRFATGQDPHLGR